jgi:hypothetical protein
MSRNLVRAAAAAGAVTFLLLSTAGPALAHEQRKVGPYQFSLGWQHEPAYTGVENAVQLIVKDSKGNAIDDLGSPPTLKVEVLTGTQKSDPLDLKASFDADTGLGTHGEFDAAIVPTAPGDYTFHFFGTIGSDKVDERFTSSDKTFDTVKDPTAAQFPAKDPSPSQLATNLDRLNPRVESALSLAQSTSRAAKRASDKASTAQTLGIVALVVGVVVGGAGLVAGMTARRS